MEEGSDGGLIQERRERTGEERRERKKARTEAEAEGDPAPRRSETEEERETAAARPRRGTGKRAQKMVSNSGVKGSARPVMPLDPNAE